MTQRRSSRPQRLLYWAFLLVSALCASSWVPVVLSGELRGLALWIHVSLGLPFAILWLLFAWLGLGRVRDACRGSTLAAFVAVGLSGGIVMGTIALAMTSKIGETDFGWLLQSHAWSGLVGTVSLLALGCLRFRERRRDRARSSSSPV